MQEQQGDEGGGREADAHAPSERGASPPAAPSRGATPRSNGTPTPEPAQQGGRGKRARRSASYAGMDRGDPDPRDEGDPGDPERGGAKRARRSRSRATEERAGSDPRGVWDPEEEDAGLPMRGASGGAPSRGRQALTPNLAEEAPLSPGDEHYVENESELFCVCQQPYNVDTAMISCDGCAEWYHLRCVGLTQARGPGRVPVALLVVCCQQSASCTRPHVS